MDTASREVIAAEKKAQEDEAERRNNLNKKRKNKMRGRSSTKERAAQKESVYDDATRTKIKEILNNKLKLKRLEKKKATEERKMIENEDLFEDLNPVEVLKKVKR